MITFLILLDLIGCSPSSHNQRYGRKEEEQKDSANSLVRFTSADDNQKHEQETNLQTDPPIDTELSEFDQNPVEENPVDKGEFIRKYKKFGLLTPALTTREKVLFEIIEYLETPYLYGGVTSDGIDCSAFTKQVYEKTLNKYLPRTAREQFQTGEKILEIDKLKFGDLVYFNTSKSSYPGHVGIYIGENLFAHASLSQGVTISSLESSYYARRFISGTRIENLE